MMKSNNPPDPSHHFMDLKLDIATYAAFLWTLFGYLCELYKQHLTVHSNIVMDKSVVEANSDNFTPLLCQQITWELIEEGRYYLH